MPSTMMNGRQRKSLSDQIDRLDSLLDGLADGLSEAVAAAVQEGVRAVLTEVLTNPELLARLKAAQDVAPPPNAAPPSGAWLAQTWERVRDACRLAGQQVVNCRVPVAQRCTAAWDQVHEQGRHVRAQALRLLSAAAGFLDRGRRFVRPALAALGLGVVTGLAGRYLGPWAAATAGAAGGLLLALKPSVSLTWLSWTWPWRVQPE